MFRADKPLPSLPGAGRTSNALSLTSLSKVLKAPPSTSSSSDRTAGDSIDMGRVSVLTARALFEEKQRGGTMPTLPVKPTVKLAPSATEPGGVQANVSFKPNRDFRAADLAKSAAIAGRVFRDYNASTTTQQWSSDATPEWSATPRTAAAAASVPPPPLAATQPAASRVTAAAQQQQAIVLFDFDSTHKDELASRVGDRLLVRRSVGEWVDAHNLNTGFDGIIPKTFLDIEGQSAKPPSPPKPAALSQGGELDECVALYDYSSGERGDLNFRKGDVVRVRRRVNDEWLDGCLADGRAGIFPSNFVSFDAVPRAPPPPVESAEAGRVVTALFDYTSGHTDDLCFRAGDRIRVLHRVDADWMRGTLLLDLSNQRSLPTGIFPANFVQF